MASVSVDTAIDPFPSSVSVRVTRLRHPNHKEEFAHMYFSGYVSPFILFLNGAKIYCKMVKRTKQNDEKLSKNFVYNGERSASLEKEFTPGSLFWRSVEKHLQGNRYDRQDLKKNVDQRTMYRYDDNVFLVKHYFTFGQQTVPSGYGHLVQTTDVPMVFYHLPKENKNAIRLENRSFEIGHQHLFDQYVLQTNTAYWVPADTTYVLVTLQKTLFSLDVVPEGCNLPFKCRHPLEHTKFLKRDPYDVPPPTPAMEVYLPKRRKVCDEPQPTADDMDVYSPKSRKVCEKPAVLKAAVVLTDCMQKKNVEKTHPEPAVLKEASVVLTDCLKEPKKRERMHEPEFKRPADPEPKTKRPRLANREPRLEKRSDAALRPPNAHERKVGNEMPPMVDAEEPPVKYLDPEQDEPLDLSKSSPLSVEQTPVNDQDPLDLSKPHYSPVSEMDPEENGNSQSIPQADQHLQSLPTVDTQITDINKWLSEVTQQDLLRLSVEQLNTSGQPIAWSQELFDSLFVF